MLRKKASFKPNLNQVRQEQVPAPTVPNATPAIPTAPTKTQPQSVTPSADPLISPVQPSPPVPARVSAIIPAVPTNDPTPQDVTRLVGLRNSAYKNVKLKDLLFFNPPLTKDQKRHKKNERKRLSEGQTNEPGNADVEIKESIKMQEMDTEETSLVPKVKLGPDGQLVLDESTTVIKRKNSIKSQEAIVEDNEEIISRTNYDSYRRKPTSSTQTKWSADDTQKFYHALSIFGTDFSMMESLLFSGHRSRTELHKKFKREERINKVKIDVALSKNISLNSEELDNLKDIFSFILPPNKDSESS